MALDVNTYGTVAGVERLIGDMVEVRRFTAESSPSLSQAEQALDHIASEINVELDTAGYSYPVNVATDAIVHMLLVHANQAGAAAYLLSTVPAAASIGFDSTDEVGNRKQFYWGQLNRTLKRIREQRINATRDKAVTEHLIAGARLDSDGNEKLPLFTRDLTDYPGSRSLTE